MPDLYAEIMAASNRRMDAAAIELTNALKEALSVPVPRLVNKSSGRGQGKTRRTFVKNGKTLALVTRGHLKSLNGETFLVPGKLRSAPTHPPAPNSYSASAGESWVIYYTSSGKAVFVKKATPGAPPRKFEGAFRRSQTWERLASTGQLVRRVGTNDKRARGFEYGTHPYFTPTLFRVKGKLEGIIGQSL